MDGYVNGSQAQRFGRGGDEDGNGNGNGNGKCAGVRDGSC
jgi:hypothetical protein